MADVRCKFCQATTELTPAQSASLGRDFRATLLCRACRQSFEFVLPKTVGMESTTEFYPFAATDPNMADLADLVAKRRASETDAESPPSIAPVGGIPAWVVWGVPLLLLALAAAALMFIL